VGVEFDDGEGEVGEVPGGLSMSMGRTSNEILSRPIHYHQVNSSHPPERGKLSS
jgi:hypothetical protein